MVKKIVLVAGGLVVLVIVGIVVLAGNLDKLVKVGVEKGGTLVLGVPTSLDKATVSIRGGTVGLDGLVLASPEGFDSPEMFRLGHAHTTVEIGSLTGDEIVVHEVVIDGPEITLEFSGGKSNWGTVLDNLESEPAEEEKEMSQKKIRVDLIRFANAKIRVAGIPLAGTATVPLPTLVITEFRTADSGGATVRNVLADVIRSLYGSILGTVKGIVPAEELQKLGAGALSLVGDAGGLVKDAGSGLGGAAGGAAKDATGAAAGAAKGAADKATGALKGVFGGGKDNE
jgi:hypothetical protein